MWHKAGPAGYSPSRACRARPAPASAGGSAPARAPRWPPACRCSATAAGPTAAPAPAAPPLPPPPNPHAPPPRQPAGHASARGARPLVAHGQGASEAPPLLAAKRPLGPRECAGLVAGGVTRTREHGSMGGTEPLVGLFDLFGIPSRGEKRLLVPLCPDSVSCPLYPLTRQLPAATRSCLLGWLACLVWLACFPSPSPERDRATRGRADTPWSRWSMARSGAANERRHGQVPAWCRPDRARHGAAAGNTPLSTQARARVPAACGASRRGARRCRPREAKGSSRLRALRVIFCFCRRSAERAAATCACMAVMCRHRLRWTRLG